ncbi:MAG: hypothetical protein ACLT98_02425 [Eggerthellaceae bacterium]
MNASKDLNLEALELRMLEEGLGPEKTRLYCQIGHYGIGIDSFDAAGRMCVLSTKATLRWAA